MAEPEDMIVPLLREMRFEMHTRFNGVDEKIERVERRFQKLEDAQVSYRQALSVDTLMSRLLTGEFEERIEALEQKVRELEAHK